jgi:TonB-linked SusC/RagA family outer membrane protein
MIYRVVRATLRGTAAAVLCFAAAGVGAPGRAGAQEPVHEVQLAAAGPRFLATMPGRSSTGAQRWRDVSNAKIFHQRISLDLHDVTLEQALSQIGRKAGLWLTYSPNVLHLNTKVNLSASDLTVGAALSAVLYDAGVDVLVTGSGQAAIVERVDLEPPAATVSGRVTDANSGQAIPGATVSVEETRLGSLTDDKGQFRIANVPEGSHVLSARRIGYAKASKTITVSGDTTVDFTLQPSATELDQIVITGTAGNQTRAAQAAVVSTIDASDVTAKAPVSTVTDVLQGRVAGVNVTSSSGTTGAAPRINIRGAASISLSNAPLVFIDGVRVSSGSREDVGNYHGLEGLGGQAVTALNDLNPDDIESVEVVKGPAAATLYGADASAGVIQIITKKGRLGAGRFTQNVTAEWNRIQPNFTPRSVYGTCTAALVGPGGPALCQGQPVGTVVSDQPLVREDVFHNGSLQALDYSAHGGGDSFGYFVSGSINNEDGTSPANTYYRRTGRASFNWAATPQLGVEAMIGLSNNDYRVPQGDDSQYGYLTQGAFGASPFAVTVGPDGKRSGGTGIPIAGLEAIRDRITTLRVTPSVQLHYNPFGWMTNRLTVGGDLSSTHGTTFFPRNDENWYNGDQTNGYVEDVQNPIHIYTVDYLGNIRTTFGANDHISSDFSFGSQWINTTNNYLAGVGIGIAANSSNLVSSASTTESHQVFSQSKSLGFFAQEQVGFGQKLFLQAGARVDRNSAFGKAYGAFFLPKVGASYVISQEPFWSGIAPVISSLRLRAAYGTTGRSPDPGASLRTYAPFPYVTPTGGVGPGVIQASPGNPNLKPERGTEFEGGLDIGLFHERAGIELTYYDKRTSDLLLRNPLAPSLAFTINPFVNAGKVDNRGLEFTVRGTPIDRKNVTWDLAFTGSTLRNRLLSLGDVAIANQSVISPDLTLRFTPGQPLSAWYSSKIVSIDTAAGFATVTNTPVYAGPQLPTFQGNLSSTLTLFRNLRFYALFTSQRGAKILNFTSIIQDLSQTSAETNLPAGQGGYTKAEQIAHFGPFKTEDGTPVALVLDRYLQPTDFVRLQEASLTLSLPERLAQRFRASGASLTMGGRNLHLWKDKAFTGYDPEMLSTTTNTGTTQFLSAEEFTVPQPRRWFVRLNVQF